MIYEIHKDMSGQHYLKKIDSKKYTNESRGQWMDI
jgi:hypothetical protein